MYIYRIISDKPLEFPGREMTDVLCEEKGMKVNSLVISEAPVTASDVPGGCITEVGIKEIHEVFGIPKPAEIDEMLKKYGLYDIAGAEYSYRFTESFIDSCAVPEVYILVSDEREDLNRLVSHIAGSGNVSSARVTECSITSGQYVTFRYSQLMKACAGGIYITGFMYREHSDKYTGALSDICRAVKAGAEKTVNVIWLSEDNCGTAERIAGELEGLRVYIVRGM